LIEHDHNGWLFDLERPQSFHVALTTVLTDEKKRAATIAAGRQRVINEFDTRVIASGVRRLYENLVEEKHALRHSA
jgi:glycosyltransferase involved in cell wall biosynthesis